SPCRSPGSPAGRPLSTASGCLLSPTAWALSSSNRGAGAIVKSTWHGPAAATVRSPPQSPWGRSGCWGSCRSNGGSVRKPRQAAIETARRARRAQDSSPRRRAGGVAGGRRWPAPERGERRTAARVLPPRSGAEAGRRSPSADALGYYLTPYGLGRMNIVAVPGGTSLQHRQREVVFRDEVAPLRDA